jgi:hypothetical protein
MEHELKTIQTIKKCKESYKISDIHCFICYSQSLLTNCNNNYTDYHHQNTLPNWLQHWQDQASPTSCFCKLNLSQHSTHYVCTVVVTFQDLYSSLFLTVNNIFTVTNCPTHDFTFTIDVNTTTIQMDFFYLIVNKSDLNQ